MAVTEAELPAAELGRGDAYRLMTQIITPRPIAWVSTLDASGRRNLAPFSYFQAVCSTPPTIILGIGWHPDGRPKDTLANILERGEMTICHVSRALAEQMNTTSAALPPEQSEWDLAGVAAEAAQSVAPPRVAGALASMECKLTHAIPLGRHKAADSPATTLVIAEVIHFALDRGIFSRDDRGRWNAHAPKKLDSLGRLGGLSYATSNAQFDLERPRPPLPEDNTR